MIAYLPWILAHLSVTPALPAPDPDTGVHKITAIIVQISRRRTTKTPKTPTNTINPTTAIHSTTV